MRTYTYKPLTEVSRKDRPVGWVIDPAILQYAIVAPDGRLADWPLEDSEADVKRAVIEFNRDIAQLHADEASEVHGLRLMGAA